MAKAKAVGKRTTGTATSPARRASACPATGAPLAKVGAPAKAGAARSTKPAVTAPRRKPSAVRAAAARLPTQVGDFRIIVYRDIPTGKEHAAIVKGDVGGDEPVLVRIHSECLTGDLFGSLRCDCGPQLQQALRRIERAGRGLILYLRQEGRDIGLTNKILAYELQEQGRDTVEANLELGHPVDARSYEAAKDILDDLGVAKIRLLTNNPDKLEAMRELGFTCVERVPLEVASNPFNQGYLDTKRAKMGHLLK